MCDRWPTLGERPVVHFCLNCFMDTEIGLRVRHLIEVEFSIRMRS